VAFVIKCRPNDVDPELFRLPQGPRRHPRLHRHRDQQPGRHRQPEPPDHQRGQPASPAALFRELGLYCSFNVLIFDPEATLDGVEVNLDFMEEMADWPFNFCGPRSTRAPAAHGLEAQGRLRGDYFAWGYEMREPRVELLFRIASTAFAARNFKSDGVHNLNMGIRFDNEVMRFFHPRPGTSSGRAGSSRCRATWASQCAPDAPRPRLRARDRPLRSGRDQGFHPRAGP
jgi:hypothetical protein